jgi:predicted Zn-dependent protease
MAATLVDRYGSCETANYPQVQTVANTLLANFPAKFSYNITILNCRQINSFGCPGGYVLINRGLLEEIGNAEHELAFPVARQIIHANHSKALERIFYAKTADALLQGQEPRFNERAIAIQLVDMLLTCREHKTEYKVDRTAVGLMIDSGYDPDGALRYLRRCQNSPHNTELTRAMPPFGTRAERIKQLIVKYKLEGRIE